MLNSDVREITTGE